MLGARLLGKEVGVDNAAWIVSVLLAGLFVGAGGAKLATPIEKLRANKNMAWTNDFQPSQVKGIGLAEVLGAIGLIVPWATGVLPFLTPIAALGLVALQVGAAITHIRRSERQILPINVILIVLAIFVAVVRFADF
jgi:uncharacterized membrane protein YphA (DoxX/SURF4 family)